MPTKFYLHNAAAPYTPATIRGAWDQTAGAVTKALDTQREGGGANAIIQIAETSATNPFRVLLGRWISGPLGAQTLSGTVDVLLGISESLSAADMNWYLHIYVTQGNSDTPRGTILGDFSEGLGVNEWPTATTFKGLNAAAALSSLAINAGDRIVCEIGYVSREASATSRTGALRYGTLNAATLAVQADGAVAGTDVTLKSGFITFSGTITEDTVSVRLSQAVVDVLAGAPASADVRLSQMVIEVLSQNVPLAPDPPGGGIPPGSGVEPTNGTTICGADPVYKTVRIQTDAGEKRYSYGDLPLGKTFRESRILSIGPIRRALSDLTGRMETARTTIRIWDGDGTLRGLAASGSLRLNKRVDVYAATEAQLRADATERRIASLLIRDFKFDGLTCTLQCEDYFGSILGEYGARVMIPKRTLGPADFPNLPIELYGKPVPIGYGLLSDESFGSNAIGIAPAIFVGARRLSDGQDWDEYVVYGHAATSWQSIFASNLGLDADLKPKPRPVKMDLASLEGVEFLVPTYAGWNAIVGSDPFVDYNGHRYAVFFARGERSLDHRTGKCPISVNVPGVENVGDGSGTLITELWLQILHFINNFWIQSYQTGNWLSYPTVNGVYSRIATLSFAAMNALTAARLGGSPSIGYLGAWMLGQDGTQKDISSALGQLLRDVDGDVGIDRHGRIIASAMTTSTASVASFVDTQQEITDGSFAANRRMPYLYNAVQIKYMRNYVPETRSEFAIDSARTAYLWWADGWLAGGYPAYGTVQLEDSVSQSEVTGIGERRLLDLEGWSLRDPTTAFSVGAYKLARLSDGPIYSELTTGLCGDNVDVGDYYAVTSQEGMDTSGWTAKKLRCEAIMYLLDEDLVTLEGQVAA